MQQHPFGDLVEVVLELLIRGLECHENLEKCEFAQNLSGRDLKRLFQFSFR